MWALKAPMAELLQPSDFLSSQPTRHLRQLRPPLHWNVGEVRAIQLLLLPHLYAKGRIGRAMPQKLREKQIGAKKEFVIISCA
jgi:hypothetical protein